MQHAIHRVTAFRFVGPYTVHVSFDDGTAQEIDFEPVLVGRLFGPLKDPAVFAQVRIDDEAATLVWPNGADFDPATLHDWPEHAAAWEQRAKKWEAARESAS